MQNKSILFILDYYKPHKGGSETVFENIISRISNQGYNIHILTSKFSNKLKTFESLDNISIYRTGSSRINFMLKSIFLGIKILKNNNIDIIHTSTYGGALPAYILAKLFKKKIIITVHEIFAKLWLLYKGKFKGRLYILFEKLIFSCKYDIYHCVSLYTMNSIRLVYGISDSKLRVINNGVDSFRDSNKVDTNRLSDFKKKHNIDDKFTILYYGHTGKSKGIEFLINAINDIYNKIPNAQLIFNVIESKSNNKIIQTIKQNPYYHLHHKIRLFHGFEQEDLRLLVASADVVIAPSLSEGFGSVHTETVAMGVPLITTYIGPLPEVLGGKVIFIPPQSSKAIVDAISKTYKGDIHPLPQKTFSWDSAVEKLTNIYITIQQ